MAWENQKTGYLAETTLTAFVTLPATQKGEKVIESMTLTNTNSSTETIDLVIARADGSANDYLLAVDYQLAAGTLVTDFATGKRLRPGDSIQGNTTTGSKVVCSVQFGNVPKS